MTVFADIPPGLMRKFVIRTTLWIIFLGVVLFGTAGTIHWPQGWIYLGFLTVVSFVSGPWLAKHDPELFRERLGSLFQKEQKSWDKLWVIAMMVVWLGGLVAPVLTYVAVTYGVGLGVSMMAGTVVGAVSNICALLLSPETKGKVLAADLVLA